MCVVSMIYNYWHDKWNNPPYKWPTPTYPSIEPVQPIQLVQPFVPVWPVPQPQQKPITDDEIRELRELLRRAREYDKKNNEPDCELEEKKKKLLDLANELGVDIAFIEED